MKKKLSLFLFLVCAFFLLRAQTYRIGETDSIASSKNNVEIRFTNGTVLRCFSYEYTQGGNMEIGFLYGYGSDEQEVWRSGNYGEIQSIRIIRNNYNTRKKCTIPQ